MMPWPKKAALHSLSHIRHQRDAGERPGGNARPYPGFFLPGPGPGYAQERKNIFQIAKGRKNTPSWTHKDARGRKNCGVVALCVG